MSLQEEIVEMLPWEIHSTRKNRENAQAIINKVLDAAIVAIQEEYPDYHEDAYICIQAIQALKEGKG
jgi:hypothetical protein